MYKLKLNKRLIFKKVASRVIICHQMSRRKEKQEGEKAEMREKEVNHTLSKPCRAEGAEVPYFLSETIIFCRVQILETGFSLYYLSAIRQRSRHVYLKRLCVTSVTVSPYNNPSNSKRSRSVFFKWIFSDFSRIENSFGKPTAGTGRQNVWDLSLL